MSNENKPVHMGRAWSFLAGVLALVATPVLDLGVGGVFFGVLFLVASVFWPWGDL